MGSPVLSNQFKNSYSSSTLNAQASGGGVLTYDNAMRKIVVTFSVLLASAAVGWFVPVLMLPALLIALVLGLVNAFKKEPSPPLILAYAVAEGLVIGGLSGLMEQQNPGIVSQAVLGTLCVATVVLFLYKAGIVRESAKMTKIFLFAMLGYLLFSLVNLGLSATGVINDAWGLHSATIPGTSIPLGIVLGVFAVLLASYSLVMDFTYIDEGVRFGAPEKAGWTAAFGITVTLVWLYLELLRMLSLSRD